MKNLLKIQLLTLVFLFPIVTNAAINKQTNQNQDSTLVMTYIGKSKKKKNHSFKKGDKVIYRDNKGKHKVEIVGFDKQDVIVKDIKKQKVSRLNLEEVDYFQEYSASEEDVTHILKAFGGFGLVMVLGLSLTEKDSLLGSGGAFIFLMVFFIPLVLIVWGTWRLISVSKRPIYKPSKDYQFEVKG